MYKYSKSDQFTILLMKSFEYEVIISDEDSTSSTSTCNNFKGVTGFDGIRK